MINSTLTTSPFSRSSSALILTAMGYPRTMPGVFTPDADHNESSWDREDTTQAFKQQDNNNINTHDDDDDNNDQDQQGEEGLGRALKRTIYDLQLQELNQHVKELLTEFRYLLNQLQLLSSGVEMDPSLAKSLSMDLQKLQRNLTTAMRDSKAFSPKTELGKELHTNLNEAHRHLIDANHLHGEIFEPTPEPSSPRLR